LKDRPTKRTDTPIAVGCAVILACLLIGGVSRSWAQDGTPSSETVTPFTHYIPASAGLYVNVSRLGEVNEALHRVNAWRWLPLLLGATASDQFPGDLQQAVGKLLGTTTFRGERDLMRSEVGIVASSLMDLDHAVWMVRTPDAGAADRWFPENSRTAQADFGAARSFRMKDGLIVCARDGIVALARRWENDSLVLSTMYLLRGRSGPTLDELPALQRARGYLPARPLATAYLRGTPAPADHAEKRSAAHGTATTSRAVASGELIAGLYEADDGLDLAVRGASTSVADLPAVAPATVERMLQLPRSTLLAVARGVDWSALIQTTPDTSPSGWLARYLSFLFNVRGSQSGVPAPFDRLGSNVVLVWDQNFAPDSAAPQFALLLETQEPEYVALQVRQAVARLKDLVSVVDSPAASRAIGLEDSVHLGDPITCAPLRAYALASAHKSTRLLADVAPCWTATGGWFIFALGRDHLERILDAQRGFGPSLSIMREASSLRRTRSAVRLAALVQGELASEVLDEWVGGAGGDGSFLAPGWWDDLIGQGRVGRRRVGIGMRTQQKPGVVIVGRVYAGTAADGRLEVADRILGVDGSLLALENPNADLRSRIDQSLARPGPTLRVKRGQTMLDVVLPLKDAPEAFTRLGMKPADAVREVASVFRSIPFASFVLSSADEGHYSARVNVRFASETTATQIPPE